MHMNGCGFCLSFRLKLSDLTLFSILLQDHTMQYLVMYMHAPYTLVVYCRKGEGEKGGGEEKGVERRQGRDGKGGEEKFLMD